MNEGVAGTEFVSSVVDGPTPAPEASPNRGGNPAMVTVWNNVVIRLQQQTIRTCVCFLELQHTGIYIRSNFRAKAGHGARSDSSESDILLF